MARKLVALGLGVLILAGCSSGGSIQEVRVETRETAYKQTHIEVEAGRPVRIQLVNADTVLHDLSIEKIAVKVKSQGHDAHNHDKPADLHVSAAAGKTGSIEFTALEPGTYIFGCTVEGHKESGMVGELVVKAAAK